jgi:Spy/CpxP family protein refolding chaperone
MKALLALSVLFVGVASASAEDKKGTPPPNVPLHQLAANEAVQTELKVTDDQKKGIEEIVTEAREALRGARNLNAEERQKKTSETRQKVDGRLEKLLKPDQYNRLTQIDLQQRGPIVLSQKKAADQMELTQEQRKEFRELQQNLTKEAAKLREGGTRGAELNEKTAKLRQEASEKVVKSLTDAQKKNWQKLTGDPFDISKITRQR